MDFTLTAAQHAIVERAAALARESLAPRAAFYDRTGTYPRESWHELWRQGFLAAAISQRPQRPASRAGSRRARKSGSLR